MKAERGAALLTAVLAVLVLAACGQKQAAATPEAEPPAPPPVEASAPAEAGVTIQQVADFIRTHVSTQAPDGKLTVADEKTGADLSLTLDRVHEERLSKVAEGRYFVCADFKAADGAKVYDLDFWVEGSTPEALQVTGVTIHKEDGVERYTWLEREGLWVQQPVEEPGSPGGGGAEHPEHPKGK